MKAAYQRLLTTTETMVQQAKKVKEALKAHAAPVAPLLNTLDQFIPLVEQVIDQTTRRVLYGELVPAGVVSLFEPHTRIISKGKAQRPTEFGRAIWVKWMVGSLAAMRYWSVFHKPPQLLTGNRSTYSAENERYAESKGVKYIALPKPGAKSHDRVIHEKQPWFRRGHKWRSGMEGRISLLKRRYKLGRCLYHGEDGMERWVGWGVIAHDLWIIANKMAS